MLTNPSGDIVDRCQQSTTGMKCPVPPLIAVQSVWLARTEEGEKDPLRRRVDSCQKCTTELKQTVLWGAA
jgi:hypothetical protein